MNENRPEPVAPKSVTSSRKGTGRLEDLFWKHAPEALHLGFLLTGSVHTAEDLVQEAFVRVAGRLQSLLNPDAFGTYLKRTVVNLAKDHFRKISRERVFVREAEPFARDLVEESESTRVIVRSDLLQALRRLPYRQRAAVVLRYCEGMTEIETAEVLNTSVPAAKSLASRGLVALRKDLVRRDYA